MVSIILYFYPIPISIQIELGAQLHPNFHGDSQDVFVREGGKVLVDPRRADGGGKWGTVPRRLLRKELVEIEVHQLSIIKHKHGNIKLLL